MKTLQATVDAVRRPLFAGVLVVLALSAPGAAWADGGGTAAPPAGGTKAPKAKAKRKAAGKGAPAAAP